MVDMTVSIHLSDEDAKILLKEVRARLFYLRTYQLSVSIQKRACLQSVVAQLEGQAKPEVEEEWGL